MRSLYSSILFLLFSTGIYSQGMWIWIAGDTAGTAGPNYGTMGVAAPTNEPGGRYEGHEWTTPDGKMWLYGGQVSGFRSDMWQFDPITNMWTWISGANNTAASPVYGTKGVPAAANSPGTKSLGAATWVDNNGNLWLFGGMGVNPGAVSMGNDMWKYDVTTGQWAWMHGNATNGFTPRNGTKGVFHPLNTPGGRLEATCSWTDQTGKLWFFGGQAKDSQGTNGSLNDLWVYDPAINEWAWMGGDTIANKYGIYGTQGVGSVNNYPGARQLYTNWIDDNGDLWLWGGSGYGESSLGLLNDLWKYEIATGEWTWMHGSKLTNRSSTFGTKCVEATNNTPGGKSETRAEWKDLCGNFWLYGGSGSGGYWNDLWRYNTTTNQWAWISGGNVSGQTSVIGTKGVANAANRPGAVMGAHGWLSNGGLWVFGGVTTGSNYKFIDVLWKFILDKPTVAYTPSPTSGCGPLTVNFTDGSNPNCDEIKYWSWNFDDPLSGANNTSSQQNPTHIFNNNGTYNVKLIITSCTGAKDSVTHTITVYGPVINTGTLSATICKGETATLSVSGANSYNWAPNSGLSGTTGSTVSATPTANTTYTVIGDAGGGCISTTTITVNVNDTPTITVSDDDTICINTSANLSATGASNYTWLPVAGLSSTTGGNVVATPLTTSTFVVVGSNGGTCNDTADIVITVIPPQAVNLGSDTTINKGNSVTLNANTGTSYTWTPNTSLSCTSCANPVASPTVTTKYYVVITDANGCSNIDSITVFVVEECIGEIFIPNVFSPNNDGQNDLFCIQNSGCLQTLQFVIFDRWGRAVFETTDPANCWDGNYNGKPCNTDVFVYNLNAVYKNGNTKITKGNITLIR